MNSDDWDRIAGDIEARYDDYDGFVVLHGTDTMGYTASALSFMLENLKKPIIITGSQIPMSEMRNDGVENLLVAMLIAGHFKIPEVCLYFRSHCYRGCRSIKANSMHLSAFDSPNLAALVQVGISMEVKWDEVRPLPSTEKRLIVHRGMNKNVGILRIFPGITPSLIRHFCQPPIAGVVLQTFGAGNAPEDKEMLSAIREATDRGVIMVNVTQCPSGGVTAGAYQAGSALMEAGVISGCDMTAEAALCKLAYITSENSHFTLDQQRELLSTSLRGELTEAAKEMSFRDSNFIRGVAKALSVGHKQGEAMVNKALGPVLLCAAAELGLVGEIQGMIRSGISVNSADYDKRTALHVCASEGHEELTGFLIESSADVNVLDRLGHKPLDDALRVEADEVCRLLLKAGGQVNTQLQQGKLFDIAKTGDRAAANRMVVLCGVNPAVRDYDQRTPLMIAAAEGHRAVVEIFLRAESVHLSDQDRWGHTALDEATRYNHVEVTEFLNNLPPSPQPPGNEALMRAASF
eukprot:TRINITY_DN2086_c0_g1_i3.p1 TRINITY_DN2086_c0_g1~~TRINITY_DN2086_c0_g1_i3.p1  ORF type:complete len:520 (-),score=131.04 TRINITY_DN2086_c0_g1_i3:175-1734(-)